VQRGIFKASAEKTVVASEAQWTPDPSRPMIVVKIKSPDHGPIFQRLGWTIVSNGLANQTAPHLRDDFDAQFFPLLTGETGLSE
jgi:hypothetical protein